MNPKQMAAGVGWATLTEFRCMEDADHYGRALGA